MKTVLNHKYVFVVLEFGDDPTVHGVYVNRLEAIAKRRKLYNKNNDSGYIAILKKPLHGKTCKVSAEYYHEDSGLRSIWLERE